MSPTDVSRSAPVHHPGNPFYTNQSSSVQPNYLPNSPGLAAYSPPPSPPDLERRNLHSPHPGPRDRSNLLSLNFTSFETASYPRHMTQSGVTTNGMKNMECYISTAVEERRTIATSPLPVQVATRIFRIGLHESPRSKVQEKHGGQHWR